MRYLDRVERDTRLGEFLISLENARKSVLAEVETRHYPKILFNWWDS